jgi:hypothetical protein
MLNLLSNFREQISLFQDKRNPILQNAQSFIVSFFKDRNSYNLKELTKLLQDNYLFLYNESVEILFADILVNNNGRLQLKQK